MANPFSESRLELFPTNWQVVVSFDTLILQNGAGEEIRYCRIVEPRYKFSASDMVLNQTEYEYLKSFFESRKGKYEGFRFTNPLDSQCHGLEKTLATGITTQGILVETATAGQFQLVKRYTVAGVNCYKTIRKIKPDTTVFYSGGVVSNGPTIDLNSGIVTGASAGMTVDCEYDLLVRFDIDEIELNHIVVESEDYQTVNQYQVNGIQLTEVNYPKIYSYELADFTDLVYTLTPEPLPEITKGVSTIARIESSQNTKESRVTFSGNKQSYKLGQNILYQSEVDVFYALFLACKGRKLGFTYDTIPVRLSNDELTLNLEVFDPANQSVWSLSGLQAIAVLTAPEPPPPPDPPGPLAPGFWKMDMTSVEYTDTGNPTGQTAVYTDFANEGLYPGMNRNGSSIIIGNYTGSVPILFTSVSFKIIQGANWTNCQIYSWRININGALDDVIDFSGFISEGAYDEADSVHPNYSGYPFCPGITRYARPVPQIIYRYDTNNYLATPTHTLVNGVDFTIDADTGVITYLI